MTQRTVREATAMDRRDALVAATDRVLRLTIPGTPASVLSPNRASGRHWGNRAIRGAKRDLAWATKAGFLAAASRGALSPPIEVRIVVCWERGRKAMDPDNLLASLKTGCIDRLADLLGVNDRGFVFPPIVQSWDPDGQGYMEVEVREVRDG